MSTQLQSALLLLQVSGERAVDSAAAGEGVPQRGQAPGGHAVRAQ